MLINVAPGPISNTPSGAPPSPNRVCTACKKRTGWVICSHQYSAVCNASAAAAPVSVEINRTSSAGARNGTAPTTAPNATAAAAIIGEWKACETASSVCSCAYRCCTNAASASCGPATTVMPSPFSAAMTTSAGSARRTLSAESRIAAMPPGSQSAISWPRRAASISASPLSITPATTAAANSPIECPSTCDGAKPRACHIAACASCNATSAGCWYCVSCRHAECSGLASNSHCSSGASTHAVSCSV
ncbi:Uncharacterised protein [Serratia entomophila]|nr:Uncharacterised protein [Serratia entomophila]CAI1180311.1 Uncharacterised protein [Serratia entomophila]CAI1184112.1 Uncharacterised protein [Serratia entomophila]CAI1184253.1 Uncharacterised protein [Serratia entomophila]CAI1187106.1 Uncharacterised protein [Serratia entomophila]